MRLTYEDVRNMLRPMSQQVKKPTEKDFRDGLVVAVGEVERLQEVNEGLKKQLQECPQPLTKEELEAHQLALDYERLQKDKTDVDNELKKARKGLESAKELLRGVYGELTARSSFSEDEVYGLIMTAAHLARRYQEDMAMQLDKTLIQADRNAKLCDIYHAAWKNLKLEVSRALAYQEAVAQCKTPQPPSLGSAPLGVLSVLGEMFENLENQLKEKRDERAEQDHREDQKPA